jgi:hypothetical protein
MVYDAKTRTVIMFGGYGQTADLSDTWSWNGTTWTQLFPSSNPPPLDDEAAAYDPSTGTVVLFGGFSNGSVNPATWVFNGSTWSEQALPTSPPALFGATMTYDSAAHDIVLFGGMTDGGPTSSGTWVYNGTSWIQQSPAASPPGLFGATMSYDAVSHQAVLFGGYTVDLFSPQNQTWAWNGKTWTQLAPSISPSDRCGAASAYDLKTKSIVLFGGIGDSGPSSEVLLGDTWNFG